MMSFPFSWVRGLSGLPAPAVDETPLVFELFNLEQLQAHALHLAQGQKTSHLRGLERLLPRLADNEHRLRDCVSSLEASQAAGQKLTPAADWILDNFHVIEEQIRLSRRHLPRGYSRELPQLTSPAFRGYPRVYHLALELIAHVDGRIDRENIGRFVSAYQSVSLLTMGELWAIPIMLRLALIENLRRVAVRVHVGLADRALAQDWAAQILAAAETGPKALLLASADMARSNPPLSHAFVAEFVQRLQEKGGLVDIPLTWIDHQLATLGTTRPERVQHESYQQASDQVSVSASIGSLRFLSTLPWRELVEEQSELDHILRRDPAGIYPAMDFASRDHYRHVVEGLGKRSGEGELVVARRALALATAGASAADERLGHVGYYLLQQGRSQLLAELPLSRLARFVDRHSVPLGALGYAGTLVGVTTLLTGLLVGGLDLYGLPAWIIGILGAVAASQLGVAAANWLVTALRQPAFLPRMDFSQHIPPGSRCLVVVPSLVSSLEGVESLLEGLEVRYLGNRRENLYFGLLTDFADAKTELLPEDEALQVALCEGIQRLNRRYTGSGEAAFFLFHRPREWNPGEQCWMGYERKRGKLEALNHLLRGKSFRPGSPRPNFSVVIGDPDLFASIRFVLTLDTDTQLPPEAAHKLIGSLSHPLNRARFDKNTAAITEGYGILQPRVAIHLPATRRSWFVRLYAGDAGTDPYTLAVSDVYQDLFGEGSFVGKGIYDVDAFTQVLDRRLPENLILSHDLIEGCYARSGLVSDVLLYEDHPSHYVEDIKRRRRWIRGDWQIFYWILPWAPDRDKTWHRNQLSYLSRWKIVDNLRRSLVPVAGLGMLVGAFFGGGPGLVLAVVGLYALPPLFSSAVGFAKRPEDSDMSFHLLFELRGLARRTAHAALSLVFLPEDARNSLDAILHSWGRMMLTGQRLLEWRSPHDTHTTPDWRLRHFYGCMNIGPLLALLLVVPLALWQPQRLSYAGPFLLLWALSPWVAAWLSRSRSERPESLPLADQLALRRIARKTWRFFETFVGEEDCYLPPDNFQEFPAEVVAHRTSPTNMGIALLANLAAHDFGYISTERLLRRTRAAFGSMEKMERFQGHFYNWYDSRSLQPLHPLYVSTVDSGNLTGHLLTLQPALNQLAELPVISARVWAGLVDCLELLIEAAPGLAAPLAALRKSLDTSTMLPLEMREKSVFLIDTLRRLEGESLGEEARYWLHALQRQCADVLVRPLDSLEGCLAPVPLLGALIKRGEEEEPAWKPVARLEAERMIEEARQLGEACEELGQVRYEFLYDETRELLSIGYNVTDHRRDPGCYDLLASEARLVSYVAIAQGDLPQRHWFALGRLLGSWHGEAALLSWSGSMFEYLMPLLVMPSFPATLLDLTCRSAVGRQIEYGKQLGIPWGVSESGYNATDMQLNYQYKAFGVPGLGFKRGLGEDRVVAPYATVMALMVEPGAACANLRRLSEAGFEGRYGYYEAIDYSPQRQAPGQSHTVIRSFMAHHQGMSFLALASVLLDQPMQQRFRSRPAFKAVELLLHEKIPRQASLHPTAREAGEGVLVPKDAGPALFVVTTPHSPRPEVHLLSNGRYSVMITAAGGGYSRWMDLALTRWREDPTKDDWGSFCYVRDTDSNELWSAAHQPTGKEADHYEAIFPLSRAEFRRKDDGLELHTEIAVSPEDDIELRRYTLTNLSNRARRFELCSYSEIVLAPQAADQSHPAFSKLFVQTEIIAEKQAILCRRRARAEEEASPVMFQLFLVHGPTVGTTRFETDRRAFLGRGGNVSRPEGTLGGGQGSVLDPVVAIQCALVLAPEQSISAHMVCGVAPTREAALVLIEKYHDRHMSERVFELAWTHRQVVLGQLNIRDADAQLYLRLASAVVFCSPLWRAAATLQIKNRRGQSSLWGYGISGDLPIFLLRVGAGDHMDLVRQGLRAHAYWRMMGLSADLVILFENDSGYQQTLMEQILTAIHGNNAGAFVDKPGGIFVRRLDQVAEEDRILIQTMARVILVGGAGSFSEQVDRRLRSSPTMPAMVPRLGSQHRDLPLPPPPMPPLEFANGMGAFVDQGREYLIRLLPGERTPAPWVNVIANPHFGTVISESGSAYTWCENAHEFRLTPWENDPIRDPSGEAFYIRDEESGSWWCPTALPASSPSVHLCRHGFGYSVFSQGAHAISTEMTVFVAIDAPVKITLLKLVNRSGRSRSLSVSGFCAWVLGEQRGESLLHIHTEVDPLSGALLARNPYHREFGGRIGFFECSGRNRSITGDRSEFVGRNRGMRNPMAMGKSRLSGRVGAGLDACAAIQTYLELAPGEELELSFVVGVGRDMEDVRTLIRRFGRPTTAALALKAVKEHWAQMLGGLQVHTPDPSLDRLVNGWLGYQVISCRMWARTGYYQSGGAYGYRDQLQDGMSLLQLQPSLLREQILRCSSRQFREGDVQHWWHPPSGRGVRTHCSDDYLWLPAAVSRYVLGTGDQALLLEQSHFIEGRQVRPDEEAYGDLPVRSEERATIYEHCVRSVQYGLKFGLHGLPLMGSGDWNDGMNLVGKEGRGESVWLGFFLYDTLVAFGKVAALHGDVAFAARCTKEALRLQESLEREAWDGAWYLRGWFDSGVPLGSAQSEECQIDALPQSWAVLSGAGEHKRAHEAMEAVDQQLVKRDIGIVKLLTPPFDHTEPRAGYIQGYVPGVRENGGQYTHAAIWVAMAFAKLGDWRRAWELAGMLNPIHHSRTPAERDRYRVEPYVVSADIYGVAPHQGMGGWTWMTGAAGWMYRMYTESLLGLRVEAGRLSLRPCVPPEWPGFTLSYRHGRRRYQIQARPRGSGEARVVVNGHLLATDHLPLVDEEGEQQVEIWY